MQASQHGQSVQVISGMPVMACTLSAAAMAQHLRRAGGSAALCFANTMYADAAWASDEWGAFWADVVREVRAA